MINNKLIKCTKCGIEFNVLMMDDKILGKFRCPDCGELYTNQKESN